MTNCPQCSAPYSESDGIKCSYCSSIVYQEVKPASLYVLKTKGMLPAEARERLKQMWHEQFKGTAIANRVLILDGQVDLIAIQ